MKILFLFLDGVGLGRNDPNRNPFTIAPMRHLTELLEGGKLILTPNHTSSEDGHEPLLNTSRASLYPLDACLDVEGLPQSATGQATLITGRNVPDELGKHYGPKPNSEVAANLKNGTVFSILHEKGYNAALLNAYPPGYFDAIESGRRLPGAIAMAVRKAGIPLKNSEDFFSGQALSADFTGKGWQEYLGFPNAPLLSPYEAGERLAELASSYDLAFFEYWPSDIAGHRQDMELALDLLESLDKTLAGLINKWDDNQGLILITSDHGNLEDLSTRRHTLNPVPALLIGSQQFRNEFGRGLHNLTDITPSILKSIGASDQ
jgi:hypothetical protein